MSLWDAQLHRLQQRIKPRQRVCPTVAVVATMPGAGAFSSLDLASRINHIERFARPGSLANYWGMTLACRNSGDAQSRLGSITKEGSQLVCSLLGQMVLHVFRRDESMKAWYQRIKRRWGAKIARVAVIRRLATILWHMMRHDQPYVFEFLPRKRLSTSR